MHASNWKKKWRIKKNNKFIKVKGNKFVLKII